jgi:hypothetical protein
MAWLGTGSAAAAGSLCATNRPATSYFPGGSPARLSGSPRLVPCRYDTAFGAMEPSFAFGHDGRLLLAAWHTRLDTPGGVPPFDQVIRSNLRHTEWLDVSPSGVRQHPQSFDPQLLVDQRTGRVFNVDFLSDGQPQCSTISWSDNEGGSWQTSPLACGGFDGESIGTGPPVSSRPLGYPDIVYYCTGTTPTSAPPTTTPECSKSLDGGALFSPTGTSPYPAFSPTQDTFAPWGGDPLVGPNGTLYVPKRFNAQPWIAISHNEGLTWTDVQVASNGSGGEANRGALNSRGDIYYAYVDAKHHEPYLVYSRTQGKTWSKPMALAPPGVREGALPRPTADPAHPGRVAIAWLGSTSAPGHAPFYAYCDVLLQPCTDANYSRARWNGYLTEIQNVFAARPVLQTATVDPANRPLFTGGCSADGACKANLDFIHAQFGPDGTAWGVFVDDCAWRRQFKALLNPAAGRCEDGVGEGIFARLVPASRATRLAPALSCTNTRRARLPLHQTRTARVTRVQVFVAGAEHVAASGNDLQSVWLSGLPNGTSAIRLLETLSNGSQVDRSQMLRGCSPGGSRPGPKTGPGSGRRRRHRHPSHKPRRRRARGFTG